MLYNYGFVSYNRIRDIMCGITNREINPSESYMVKLQKKAGKALESFVFDVTEALKVYHMGESRGLQYFGFVWRYFTGWTGYVLAKMGRAIDKLTGNY